MKDNATITQQTEANRAPTGERREVSDESAKPSIEAVIAAIRADANHDSITYLMRSDIGQDGE